jgi:hypothetical protein
MSARVGPKTSAPRTVERSSTRSTREAHHTDTVKAADLVRHGRFQRRAEDRQEHKMSLRFILGH